MVYGRLLDAVIPSRCAACGMPAAGGYCEACRRDFPRIERPCRRCGLALPVSECPRENGRWRLDAVVAPFRYAEPLRSEVQALKFAGKRHLGRALGELLAEHAAAVATRIDALVAVPLHRRRFLARGYNQAVELARPVASALSVPLMVAGLARRRATRAQAQLAAPERRANVHGAFLVSHDLAGARVAIVDDVMTTGATANALALALLRAGAASVEAWTVARAL